ncbi:hypothetical protein BH23ACT7_BH23ACT7_08790 [soil metagenome]|jgi:hypothetical protein|nr:type II toxin-antitoxin system VapB family antitoxin [Euzebyaceae bacterium]
MKTTIDLPDALLREAKQLASREGTTLRAVIEAALRTELASRRRSRPFRLRDATFRGHGLRAEVAAGGWDRIRDAAYEGRGA